MKLSIAIVTWNRQKQLIEAIDSCIKCSLPQETEFIIIDNSSTDNTDVAVRNYFQNISYPYIYDKMSYNIGAGQGRNVAFSKCRGEYVYFLDDDAYIDTKSNTNFFLKSIELLDCHPKMMTLTTQIYDIAWKANRLSDKGPVIDSEIRKCYMVCGGSHFLRTSFFKGTEPYFPNKYGYEELQPSLRVADKGFLNGYTSTVKVIHNPKINKWMFSDEKNLGILINEISNQFAIKSSVYPKCVWFICWIAYMLRKKRHLTPRFHTECDKKANELIRQYNFGTRIKLRTVISLFLDFGFSIF